MSEQRLCNHPEGEVCRWCDDIPMTSAPARHNIPVGTTNVRVIVPYMVSIRVNRTCTADDAREIARQITAAADRAEAEQRAADSARPPNF